MPEYKEKSTARWNTCRYFKGRLKNKTVAEKTQAGGIRQGAHFSKQWLARYGKDRGRLKVGDVFPLRRCGVFRRPPYTADGRQTERFSDGLHKALKQMNGGFQTANTPRKSFFSATWRFGSASCGA